MAGRGDECLSVLAHPMREMREKETGDDMDSAVRTVTMRRERDFRFQVRFQGRSDVLLTDEPAPLGGGQAPSPSELLAAAVGNCLASSLLFCLQRGRIEVHDLSVEVRFAPARNDDGRLRIPRMDVRLYPTVDARDRERLGRCTALFEQFCTVTQSVRQGIDVRVELEPRTVTIPLPELVSSPDAVT